MNTVRLFISHSWTYAAEYERFINLLDGRGYFAFHNYSVPKNDPIHNAPNQAALREAIAKQIRPVQVVVILAGVYSTHSKWINSEIDLAKTMMKPIIGVESLGAERVSSVVQNHATKMVKWNSDSIVNAIREVL